jgi:hypothetical protein
MSDDRYAEWDAAYVLGALSATERHEFEEHLAGCDECSRSVAEFAAMPGILGALPRDEALSLLDDERAPGSAESWAAPVAPLPHLLPTLATRVRRTRRRRLGAIVAGSLAAAAVVAGAIAVPAVLPGRHATTEVALRPAVPSPLSATVDFTTESWGTSIRMKCAYQGERAGSGSTDDTTYRYGLYVTDRAGDTMRVATWTADPGSDVDAAGSVDTVLGQLRRVEVRNEDSGAVLLSTAL